MRKRVLLIVPLALLAAACATGPKYTEVAQKLPQLAASEGRCAVRADQDLGRAGAADDSREE